MSSRAVRGGKRRLNAPVHEMLSTPGPKYSMTLPVPPLTVRIDATLRMMSAVTEKQRQRRGDG